MSGTMLLLLASVKLPVKPVRMQLTAALIVLQGAVLPAKQAFSSFRATQHVGFVHGHASSAQLPPLTVWSADLDTLLLVKECVSAELGQDFTTMLP